MERDVTEVDRRRAEALVRAHVCFQGVRRFVDENSQKRPGASATWLSSSRMPSSSTSCVTLARWSRLFSRSATARGEVGGGQDAPPDGGRRHAEREAVAAQHWAASVHRILSDKETLDSGRYLEDPG